MTIKDIEKKIYVAFMNAAADPGDNGGTTTALSYRVLRYEVGDSLVIQTYNSGFSGNGSETWERTTDDGVRVVWHEQCVGIVTGADWLPDELVMWLKGKK